MFPYNFSEVMFGVRVVSGEYCRVTDGGDEKLDHFSGGDNFNRCSSEMRT